MEEWQKKKIEKNLPKLIQHTNCNDQLLAKLLVSNVLNTLDLLYLRTIGVNPAQKAKALYKILLTRQESYNFLIKSLQTTGQEKAVQILKEGTPLSRRTLGNISYDKANLMVFGRLGTELYKGTFAGKSAAVKVINTNVVDRDMALAEIKFLKLLANHDNILRFFSAETQDNFIYIALEICQTNLACLANDNDDRAHNINIKQVLKKCTNGIAHLHKHNVIHRSLMPANVLLKEDGQVKISNFMFSAQIPTGQSSVDVKAEIISGLDWTPPEVFCHFMDETDDRKYVALSSSSDIFLLGCIFFFALTKGSHPFGSYISRKANLLHDEPQLQNSSLESNWKKLINAMLSRNPSQRPSADDILLSNCFLSAAEVQHGKTQVDSQTTFESMSRANCGSDEERPSENKEKKKESTNSSNLSVDDEKGNNALLSAVMAGSCVPQLVQIICNDGADWKMKNTFGQSVLHVASECGHVEAIKYFAGLGAKVKCKDMFEEEPIHKVRFAKCNFIEAIHTLLEYGADINAMNEYGNTLLGLATVEKRSKYELEYIVQKGGNWKMKNMYGQSILDLAISGGNAEVIKYFVNLEFPN